MEALEKLSAEGKWYDATKSVFLSVPTFHKQSLGAPHNV